MKLVRALSAERQHPSHDGSSQYSQIGEDIKPADRSLSRGRDPLQSFGRGGLGNMRASSTSRGPEDRESLERGRGANRNLSVDGRDAVPEHSLPRSPARGGLTNISDLGTPDIEIPIHVPHPEHEIVSTGRGGVGNIRDRSQSKVRDGPEPHIRLSTPEVLVYSSGRGGAGNIRDRSQSKPPKEDRAHAHDHKSGVENLVKKVIHPHA